MRARNVEVIIPRICELDSLGLLLVARFHHERQIEIPMILMAMAPHEGESPGSRKY